MIPSISEALPQSELSCIVHTGDFCHSDSLSLLTIHDLYVGVTLFLNGTPSLSAKSVKRYLGNFQASGRSLIGYTRNQHIPHTQRTDLESKCEIGSQHRDTRFFRIHGPDKIHQCALSLTVNIKN